MRTGPSRSGESKRVFESFRGDGIETRSSIVKIVLVIVILAGLYLLGRRKKASEEASAEAAPGTPERSGASGAGAGASASDAKEHLAVLGDPSGAETEVFHMETPEGEVPFALARFSPDEKAPYYRYVSIKLASSLAMATGTAREDHFDLCLCSPREDEGAFVDMLNLAKYMVDEKAFLEGDAYFFTLPREEGAQSYLALSTEATARELRYGGSTVPLLTLVPLAPEDHAWVAEQNDRWKQRLGARIMGEWLSFRGLLPLGTLSGDALVERDREFMDRMAEEIGGQMAEGGSDWMSKCSDPEYVQVFQSFIARNSRPGSADDEIQKMGSLMAAGRYDEVIQGYRCLMESRPGDRALFTDQIGAAYFFKGEYQKAMACYIEAAQGRVASADFNLWEVCELLYKKEKDVQHLQTYLEHFPQGENRKAAEKLLKKA